MTCCESILLRVFLKDEAAFLVERFCLQRPVEERTCLKNGGIKESKWMTRSGLQNRSGEEEPESVSI